MLNDFRGAILFRFRCFESINRAKEIFPVSSDTTTARASVTSVIPNADRCLSPIDLGILVLCETGNMQAAEAIRSSAIIMAPSCKGLFLKNIFSMSLAFTFALIVSPVFL